MSFDKPIPLVTIDNTSNDDNYDIKLNQIGPVIENYNQIFPKYYIQYPYNVNKCCRYGELDNIKHFVTLANDLPFKENNNTAPRTEMRFDNITNYNKSYLFHMSFYAPELTCNCVIFQILTNQGPILQLRLKGGQIRMAGIYYINGVKYNDWNTLHFNITFTDSNTYTMNFVFNGKKWSCESSNINDCTFHFKCGIYNLKGYWVPDVNEIFIKDIFIYESN